MKGLLLKDLAIVKQQGRSLIIIVLIAAFMMLSGNDVTFVVAYANILFVMFGITTLNYDAFDNGYAFIFTLPVTRKLYVAEKYIFSLLCVVAGLSISTVLMGVMGELTEETVGFIAGYAMVAIVFVAILLPVELKFGPEKGRIAMVVIFAVVVAIVVVLKQVISDTDRLLLMEKLSQLSMGAFLGIAAIGAIAGLTISYLIARRIMEKKEF